jgi:hypothetical protein
MQLKNICNRKAHAIEKKFELKSKAHASIEEQMQSKSNCN